MKIALTGIGGVEETVEQKEAEPVRPRVGRAIETTVLPQSGNALSREIVQSGTPDEESSYRLFARCGICNRITEHDYLCGDFVVRLACLNHLETPVNA